MIDEEQHRSDFKVRDAGSYDSVVDEFDRFSDACSKPIVRRIVSLAAPIASDRVLDVGTGTGIVALHAASTLGSEGRIVGVDLSDGMLAAARNRASNAGTSAMIEFRKMDAEALALPDDSFDVVLSMYALTHFPNPTTALREMFRVLRGRGRLAIAVGSGAPLYSISGWLERFRRAPGFLAERLGRQLSAPGFLEDMMKRHLPETAGQEESAWATAHTNRTRVVQRMVKRAGFVDVRGSWMGGTLALETADDFWALQKTFSSRARKRLAGVSTAKIEPLRTEFFDVCRNVQSRGGKLVYAYGAILVTASKPWTEGTLVRGRGDG